MAEEIDAGHVAYRLVTQLLTIMVERDPGAFAALYRTNAQLLHAADDRGDDLTEHEFVLDLLGKIGG